MRKRVCDIIIETLVSKGIIDCFAVTGGGAMFLDNALYRNKKMRKVFNHHEQACAMAAEAYARVSGKLPLVCVTSGPGGTNTLTGVAGAFVDSIPMLVISGQVRYAVSVPKTGLKLRTRGVQEFDIVNTVKTMTKYAKLVIDPYDIKKEVNKAIDIALSDRPGPVWLDIPQDVQSALIEEDDLNCDDHVSAKSYISKDQFEHILQAIKSSKRPVFLLGGGVCSTHSREMVRQLLRFVRIPTVASLAGSDALYREHDLCFGPIGAVGQRSANFIVQNSDLIISIGCSLGFSATGFAQEQFAPRAKIISIDVDSEEQKKPGIDIFIKANCDLVSFIQSILVCGFTYSAPDKWLDYCWGLKKRFSPFEAAADKQPNDRVSAYVFWEAFYGKAPDDLHLVLGNNTAITSALQIGNCKEKQHILTNYNCGSMGYDLPAAIGVAIATGKDVVLATGDGSVMMNLQEFQTIYHYKLPVRTIVFSNDGYGAIRQTSKNFFNGEMIGCSPETGVSFPSFRSTADAFHIKYIKCSRNCEIRRCLLEFFETKGAVLMEVDQLLDDPVVPKVMSRIENGIMKSPSLHDMYPFLTQEEIERLMINDDE